MSLPIEQLIGMLSSEEGLQRREAAEQLARRGPEASEAALALVAACGDPEEETRQWAVAALEELGQPPESMAGTLASLVDSPCTESSYWAVTLLGRLGAKASAAVPALTAALTGAEEMAIRERAAWALGKIGSSAAAAIPALQNAAEKKQPRLARLARAAIRQIGS